MIKEIYENLLKTKFKPKMNNKIFFNMKSDTDSTQVELDYKVVLEFLNSLESESANEKIIIKSLDYLKYNNLFDNDVSTLLRSIKKVSGKQWIVIMIKIFNRRYPIKVDSFYLNEIDSIFKENLDISLSSFSQSNETNDEKYINAYFDLIYRKYNACEEKKHSEQEMAILTYLWFVLYQRRNPLQYNYETVKTFERMFVVYFADIKTSEIDNRYIKTVPIILEKDTFKVAYKNLVFLYQENLVNEKKLEKENLRKSEIIETQKTDIFALQSKYIELEKRYKQSEETIKEKELEISQLKDQIDNLNKDLDIEQGKRKFDRQLHEKQMKTLEQDIIADLMDDLELDFENINNIVSYIEDDKIQSRLMSRLDSIYDKLKGY